MFSQALFLFVTAFLLAAVEIEIEGKYGWSERIPTWYRTTGFWGKTWGFLMSGKPLTGYHLFMNALLIMMFHFGFFMGLEWSLQAELATAAKYFALAVFWDFLWFVFNPHYGIKNFKRKNIWWFAKSYWLFGLFPIDYIFGLALSVISAYLGSLTDGGSTVFEGQLGLIGLLLVFTFIAVMLSPFYRRWYKAMRKQDDRDKAEIFHTLP